MQYLGLALYAEGPTDYHFLRPLLQRLCEDLCLHEASSPVDVSEVLGLNHPEEKGNASREQRILAAARQARGAWQILFVHADGANDPQRALHDQVAPSLSLLREMFGEEGIGVAVVPVRETEAWAIIDGDAIRATFGTALSDDHLGVLPARAAEMSIDPKAALRKAFDAVQPPGRRRRKGPSPYLHTLGEKVSLSRLRDLSAFKTLEKDVKTALQLLRVIP